MRSLAFVARHGRVAPSELKAMPVLEFHAFHTALIDQLRAEQGARSGPTP